MALCVERLKIRNHGKRQDRNFATANGFLTGPWPSADRCLFSLPVHGDVRARPAVLVCGRRSNVNKMIYSRRGKRLLTVDVHTCVSQDGAQRAWTSHWESQFTFWGRPGGESDFGPSKRIEEIFVSKQNVKLTRDIPVLNSFNFCLE